MLVLSLAIALAVTGVLAFPCWPHSLRWGYLPSAAAGALLLGVALIAIGGRAVSRTAEPPIDHRAEIAAAR